MVELKIFALPISTTYTSLTRPQHKTTNTIRMSHTEIKTVEELEKLIEQTETAIRQCLAGDGDIEGLMRKIRRDIVSFN